MLSFLRRKKKSPWVKVLLLGVAASFVVGFGAFIYIGKFLGRRSPEDTLLEVGSYKVTIQEFYNKLRDTERRYKELLGDNFDQYTSRAKLKNIVLSQFITRALLLSEAKRLGVVVSDEELRRSIANFKAFQDQQGNFSLDLYERVLARYRMNPREFEDSHRMDLTIEKMRDFIQTMPSLPEIELWQSFVIASDKARLQFCSIDPADFEGQVHPTDEEIEAYFEDNKEVFRVPEHRVALHVKVEFEPLEQETSVSDEEITEFYERNLDKLFTEPEMVSARHILISVPPDSSQEMVSAAKQFAESIRQRAVGGEDFAELARRYSQDSYTRDSGGDLGYFKRGDTTREFDEVAFSLEVGEISEVVRTRLGYHIIKVEDHKPERAKDLEEVRGEILATLEDKKTQELAKSKATELAAKAREVGIEAAAKELGYEAVKAEPLSAEDIPHDADGGPAFVRALFALENEGDVAEPVKGSSAYEVLSLAEVIPDHLPTLEEARERVIVQMTSERAAKMAEQKAQSLFERAREVGLEKAAEEMGIAVDETPSFAIRNPYIPQIGQSAELKADAFAAKRGKLLPRVYRVANKLIVAKLQEHESSDPQDFKAVRYQLGRSLADRKRQELLRVWLEVARSKADVKIDEEALAQL